MTSGYMNERLSRNNDTVVTQKAKGLAVNNTISLFCWECYWLKLATFSQIVRRSQFQSFEGIEIRLVWKNIYDNWPRSSQTLKAAIFGRDPCARTGNYRLAGPVTSQVALASVTAAFLQRLKPDGLGIEIGCSTSYHRTRRMLKHRL